MRSLLLLFVLFSAGCGAGNFKTYPVTGKVSLPDGKPLAGAVVEFEIQTPDGKTLNARGEVQSDGTYKLGTYKDTDGAVEGEHRVLVIPPPYAAGSMDGPEPTQVLDRKFMSYESSALTCKVKAGENKFDIPVHGPMPGP